MSKASRQVATFVISTFVLVSGFSSAAARYDENVAYYQNQDYVKEYMEKHTGRGDITSGNINYAQAKEYRYGRLNECIAKLESLGYLMDAYRNKYSDSLTDAIYLFSQQMGLGATDGKTLTKFLQAVILSEDAQPAIIPSIPYTSYTAEKALEAERGELVFFQGTLTSVKLLATGETEYIVSYDDRMILVRYRQPKRTSTFIEADRVRVYGRKDSAKDADIIIIKANMIGFSDN